MMHILGKKEEEQEDERDNLLFTFYQLSLLQNTKRMQSVMLTEILFSCDTGKTQVKDFFVLEYIKDPR